MNERDISAESHAGALADEFMRAMLGDIQKNTEAIKASNKQIGQLSDTVGGLTGMKDRMEALEKELVSVTAVLAEVKQVVDRPGVTPEMIDGLRHGLMVHAGLFEKPIKKEVHHKHFLGWPVITLFFMACLVATSVVMVVNFREQADRYSASDIELRSLQLIKDSVLLREVFAAEKEFGDDPGQFRKDVVAEEQRREALTERLLELNDKKAEIDQLEREEKKQKK